MVHRLIFAGGYSHLTTTALFKFVMNMRSFGDDDIMVRAGDAAVSQMT